MVTDGAPCSASSTNPASSQSRLLAMSIPYRMVRPTATKKRGRSLGRSVGPGGLALLEERRHAFARAGQLGRRSHDLQRDRVGVGLGPVELGVERDLAHRL